jgi:hypothetical protein
MRPEKGPCGQTPAEGPNRRRSQHILSFIIISILVVRWLLCLEEYNKSIILIAFFLIIFSNLPSLRIRRSHKGCLLFSGVNIYFILSYLHLKKRSDSYSPSLWRLII